MLTMFYDDEAVVISAANANYTAQALSGGYKTVQSYDFWPE